MCIKSWDAQWSFTSLMKYEDSMSRVQPVSSDCKNQLWLHRLFMWRFLPLPLSLSLCFLFDVMFMHIYSNPPLTPRCSALPLMSTLLLSCSAQQQMSHLRDSVPTYKVNPWKKDFSFFFFFWAVQLAFETSVFPFRGLFSDWGGCWVSCSEIVHSDALCVAADGKWEINTVSQF